MTLKNYDDLEKQVKEFDQSIVRIAITLNLLAGVQIIGAADVSGRERRRMIKDLLDRWEKLQT